MDEFLEVIIPNNVVTKDGSVDIEKAGSIAISGLDSIIKQKERQD